MSDQMPLEDVLAGKEPEVVEPQETEEVETEAEPEKVEASEETESETEVVAADDDEPKDVKEEKAEEPEPEPSSGNTTKEVPLTALLDERDKRKELQKQIDELQAKAEENKDEPDFWNDPQAYLSEMRDELSGLMAQTVAEAKLEWTVEMARERHDDYDDILQITSQAVQENPALAEQIANHKNPGEYVYQLGKQFKQLDEAGGDVDSLREQIRREEREKVLAELKEKEDKLNKVPQALTDETNAAAPREKAEGGPTPLDNIFQYNSG